jgi:hypothetical protein
MAGTIYYWYNGRYLPLEQHPSFDVVGKFGRNPAIASGDTEDVWDYGGTYSYDSTAIGLSISSSNANDKQLYELQGLDSNWNPAKVNVYANGQTAANISGLWMRVFRLKNLGATDNAGNIYIYNATDTLTNGVPDTAAKVKAMLQVGANQTGMAIYSIPTGKRAFLRSWECTLNSNAVPATAADADFTIAVRSFGGVFRIQKWVGLSTTGSSARNFTFDIPYPDKDGILGKSDIKVTCKVQGKTCDVSSDFDLEIVDA